MKLLATMVAIAALLGAAPASGYLLYKPKSDSKIHIMKSQQRNLDHAVYVCNYGANEHKRWACKAVKWLTRELSETKAVLAPPRPVIDYCLMKIIDKEGSGFNPKRPSTWARAAMKWNGGTIARWSPHIMFGSGAYGVPQARYGDKMSSHGKDWATNPWTQIRWMIDYVQKYGGSCGALAFHNTHGYY